tara:strand:+ start:9323 stop:10024 length:702 start_codon:yes stop_codon:yes gene_type:complete
MNFFLLIIYLILLNNSLYAETSAKKPDELFHILNDNNGWSTIAIKEEITLSKKLINDMNLVALMAKQKTTIPTEIIQDIIMDIENYGQYFTSAGAFIFKEIKSEGDWAEGYHLLPVDIPLIKDREYFFRVHARGYNIEDKTSIVHWYLIDEEVRERMITQFASKDAIYLDYGAGLWMAEPIDEKEYILSYRLYLDPGGSIPDFAIELLNKMNIVNIFKDVVSEATRRNITVVP